MGIPGLLKDLKTSRTPCQLEELVGKRAAVDASDWIYKAISVPYGTFDPKQYLYGKVTRLRLFNIEPILVFDGQELPAKKAIYEERKEARRRIEADKVSGGSKGEEAGARKMGTGERSGEYEKALKEFCVRNKIMYVQAPYEADAQIAFLVQRNLVDFVISQDSDMMVYGCREVLYKLKNCSGELFKQDQIEKSWGVPYNEEAFRAVSILTGCDYLKAGLYGFGVKAARNLYCKLALPFDFQQMKTLVDLPSGFEKQFIDAANVFKYQLVFDTTTKTVIPLTPYPQGKSALDYPGAGIPFLAKGEFFNPDSKQVSLPVSQVSRTSQFLCCNKCTDLFPSYQALREHRQKRHPFECPICPRSYKKAYLRDIHLHSHDEKSVQVCKICKKEYRSLYRLKVHQNRYHRVRILFCLFCSKCFNSSANLRDHIFSRHSKKDKKWMCDQCGKMFKWRVGVIAHLAGVHGTERRFGCNLCTKGFKTRNQMLQHQKSHTGVKPWKCAFCGRGFRTKGGLRYHQRTHTGEKPYKCEFCQKGFTQSGNLDSHLRTHTGAKPYICDICGKGCTTSGSLKVHVRSHTGEKPCICNVCGKGFDTASHLKTHIRTHTGEKPFKCDFCDMEFSDQTNQKTHLRTHTGDLPFKCDFCEKRYAHQSRLQRHTRSHTGEKPFLCDVCGKGFSEKFNLKRHQGTHK